MNKSMVAQAAGLRVGQRVTIRRSSGARQGAEVVRVAGSRAYMAPELASFQVVWEHEGREALRWCSAFDLLEVEDEDEEEDEEDEDWDSDPCGGPDPFERYLEAKYDRGD
jgi:hypothetical protein